MLNKVPEATIFFWVVKIMATTVGETVSDYFNTTLNFGLVGTFFLMASLLAVALVLGVCVVFLGGSGRTCR